MEWSEVCPVCGNPEPKEVCDLCYVCSWERDPTESSPDFHSQMNNMSLNQAKANYQAYGHIGSEP